MEPDVGSPLGEGDHRQPVTVLEPSESEVVAADVQHPTLRAPRHGLGHPHLRFSSAAAEVNGNQSGLAAAGGIADGLGAGVERNDAEDYQTLHRLGWKPVVGEGEGYVEGPQLASARRPGQDAALLVQRRPIGKGLGTVAEPVAIRIRGAEGQPHLVTRIRTIDIVARQERCLVDRRVER